MKLLSLAGCILLAGTARALAGPTFLPNRRAPRSGRLDKRGGPNDISHYNITAGTFQQLIDHSDPARGHFTQRFWWLADHYAEPGAPIVFFTPGEYSAASYLDFATNLTIPGMIAQATGGAVIVFEHRYFGTSSPFTELTTPNMTYLTLENAIKDTTYFASNVHLPFDPDGKSRPDRAPWIFSGASYGGQLSAYTNVLDPGVFWAHHASSAPVQAIADFWQWFTPAQEGMAKNCSADVVLVTDHIDKVLTTGSPAEVEALKAKFGLAALAHSDDFVSVLWNIVQYWEISPVDFFTWCDYVENLWPNSGNKKPGAEGVGLEKALEGYAKYTREVYVPDYCSWFANWYDFPDWNGTDNVQCFDTYNTSTPTYTNTSLVVGRGWYWMMCDWPLEFWQDGAPKGQPSLVSRLINVSYGHRQCGLWWGPTVGVLNGKKADDVNKVTGGWLMNTTRLVWVDGQLDPWREAGVSSEYRPGGPLASTKETPVIVVPSVGHDPDLEKFRGDANSDVKKAQEDVIAIMTGWVDEFYKQKGIPRDFGNHGQV